VKVVVLAPLSLPLPLLSGDGDCGLGSKATAALLMIRRRLGSQVVRLVELKAQWRKAQWS